MIKIFVIGMPRSGTSMMCNILTQMGCDFLCEKEGIDDIYNKDLNYDGFFQRKDIHYLIGNNKLHTFDENKMHIKDCVNGFLNNNKNLNSDKIIAIKEPYLLYIIEYIIECGITIVMIRNKQDTINSCKKFISDHKIDYDNVWDKYYKKFISISSKIKYIIVDYDKLINDPQSTYEEFYNTIISLVPNLSKINISNIVKNKNTKLINSNYIHYIIKNNKILDFNIKKCHKYKPNDKCFCDTMKKYKLCCGKM